MPGPACSAWKVLILLALVGYQILAHVVLRESLGVQAVSGLSHALAYLFMLWYFGRTLLGGREALITRLARRVHGTLAPGKAEFTRRVTIAWCVFFAGQVLVSAALYALAPLEAWSMFVNVLSFPLVILMFIAGHFYRAVRFPGERNVSAARVLRAFSEMVSDPQGSKAH